MKAACWVSSARITIQMMHRYGAAVTGGYLIILAFCLIFSKEEAKLWAMGWILFAIVLVQLLLGSLSIMLQLPMGIAVAHNGMAAILLLMMVTLIFKLNRQPYSS